MLAPASGACGSSYLCEALIGVLLSVKRMTSSRPFSVRQIGNSADHSGGLCPLSSMVKTASPGSSGMDNRVNEMGPGRSSPGSAS